MSWSWSFNSTFFADYWINNSNSQDNSRKPMCTQGLPWALNSTVQYRSKALLGVWAPWRHAHECLWVLMSAVCAMIMSAHGYYEVLMCPEEWPWALVRANGAKVPHSWVLLSIYVSTHKLPRALMNRALWCQPHSWALMSIYKQSAILRIALWHHNQRCSWVLMGASALLSDPKINFQ